MTDPGHLVVILGPTASGKSALGIGLAEKLGGEVLVCDSTQVYRYFDIGTAKVLAAEQRGVPHHLVDLLEPNELFTAGEYRRRAVSILEDIRLRRKLPILTAGTGLYLRALLEGLSDAPQRSDELRDRLRAKGRQRSSGYLHRLLTRLDSTTAARIAPQDTQKVIRAIEMRVIAGKPVTEIHGAGRSPLEGYAVTKIGLLPERSALYARIDRRVLQMMNAGWKEEVRKLIAGGVPANAKPFQFIGYSDLQRCLEGLISESDAVARIQTATRQFAKRQITWFRREPQVQWLEGFGDDSQILSTALGLVQNQNEVPPENHL